MRIKLIVLSGLIFLVSCTQSRTTPVKKIGFSQCFSDDAWRIEMQEDMVRQAALLPNIELIIKDGEGSTEKQIQDIKNLYKDGIDALIVSPNESEPLTEIVNEVYKSGIPVIVVDRKIENENYSAYIGADNIAVGTIAGELVTELTSKSSIRIAEVWGLMGSSPARERHQGFISHLNSNNINYELLELFGDWTGSSITPSIIDDLIQFNPDIIYAHNDFMAAEIARKLSAINVFKPIVGTDGLSTLGGGMELVNNGILSSTVLYPTGGNEAIRICNNILSGENYIKSNLLEAISITDKNVQLLLAQSNKTKELQSIISKQNTAIVEGEKVLNTQQNRFLLLVILISIIALTTIGLVLIIWRNQRINNQLASQNQKLEEQSEKLELLSQLEQQSTDEKLRFFTNVSHELKTPLSLIKVPLEEVIRSTSDRNIQKELSLALKSTRRLGSLVEELLDFRKLQSQGIQLRTFDVQLNDYFEVFYNEFSSASKRLGIQFNFINELKIDHAIFDPEAMDKIVSNLLSNAFKFTPKGGAIGIEISNSPNNLKIRVNDSGSGIQRRHLPYVFDRYYQGNSALFPGSGLGLALTKELVELHNGTIEIETELGEGTIFTVKIPLQKFKSERVAYIGGAPQNYIDKRKAPIKEKVESIAPRAEREHNETSPTIMLIEDDNDFGDYLQSKLASKYNTLWFKNAKTALNHLNKESVDAIITDVMLPGMNGIELVQTIRSNEETKHIPIIVATALNNDQVRIDLKNLDVQEFLAKPFSIELLESSLKQSINRKHASDSSTEQNLKHRISAIIEEHYSNPNFGTGDLAKALNMSRVQLYRKTKDLFSDPIGSVINSTRLAKAHDLIISSSLNISEIANQCGFTNASYFSKSVKARYGFTPNQIRQQRYD